jgi:hypothetical protein
MYRLVESVLIPCTTRRMQYPAHTVSGRRTYVGLHMVLVVADNAWQTMPEGPLHNRGKIKQKINTGCRVWPHINTHQTAKWGMKRSNLARNCSSVENITQRICCACAGVDGGCHNQREVPPMREGRGFGRLLENCGDFEVFENKMHVMWSDRYVIVCKIQPLLYSRVVLIFVTAMPDEPARGDLLILVPSMRNYCKKWPLTLWN